MLAIINEELMSYDTMEVHDKQSGKMYFKLKMLTSNKLLQPESTLKSGQSPKSGKDNRPYRVESLNDPLVPVNKEVIRISAPLKKIKDMQESLKNSSIPLGWLECPMSINVVNPGRFVPQVDIRCHEQGEDRANVYVIAFPFNGMIKPIPEDPRYRIYKGFIASSAKPFFYNNHKYRKILYLVIEVNKNLFKEDHKYHTDMVNIDLESYALFKDKDTGKEKTNHETMHLTIQGVGDCAQVWEYELIDDAIYMNVAPGEQLWTTYNFGKDEKSGHKKGGHPQAGSKQPPKRNHPKSSNRQKGFTVEGNVLVTTNKHGIRKEIPMNNGRPQRRNKPGGFNNNRNSKPGTIDDMIARSGMYEDKSHRGKKNGGKKPPYKH